MYLDGLIVVTNAHGSLRPIYALRTDAAGDITGNRSALAWSEERAGNYLQTPLLHNGLGYFCFDNGVLSVFQLSTGERLYQLIRQPGPIEDRRFEIELAEPGASAFCFTFG